MEIIGIVIIGIVIIGGILAIEVLLKNFFPLRRKEISIGTNVLKVLFILFGSIYLKAYVVASIFAIIILLYVSYLLVKAYLRKKKAKELEEEQRCKDERDGVVYTLKESEYRELN